MASKAKTKTRFAQGTTSLQARAILAEKIKVLLATVGWTQTEAASLCGLTQPRISDLRRGKPGRFSLDSLVNIAATLERNFLLLKKTLWNRQIRKVSATLPNSWQSWLRGQ